MKYLWRKVWEKQMPGYKKTFLKKTHLNFLITRPFSIITLFLLLITFPRQAFPTYHALVTDQGNGSVVVINLEKREVVNTIPVGINPMGIVTDGYGYAYVANSISNSVSVIKIDIPNSSVEATIEASFNMPLNLDITPDNSYLFVTNAGIGGGISVINTSTRSVETTIIPQSIYSSPRDIDTDGNHAYVSYPDDFTVLSLDITNDYIEEWYVITSPDQPQRLIATFDPDYIYVTTGYSVIQIDPSLTTPSYITYSGNYFSTPANLALHPNGVDLYVTNKGDNSVTVINTDQGELLAYINAGISPNSIAFDPDGTYAYVVNTVGGSISVIDTNTTPPAVIDTISDLKLIAPIEIAIIEGPLNSPPFEPFAPYPTDGGVEVPVSITLNWEGGDVDEEPVIYDVFMGTDLEMELGQICAGIEHPDTSCTPPTPLEPETTYYWMVKATDDYGNISEVAYPYWNFTTESAAPCEVIIDPPSVTVTFGEIIQFNAFTTCNGESVSGNYIWGLNSSLGSVIDENGLYTAGTLEGTDIITVLDADNGEITAEAFVEVVAFGPLCEVTISPESAIVSSGETITFLATTTPISPNNECAASSYQWIVDTPIGSSIAQNGLYTAGINNTEIDRLDVITVTDTANENIMAAAEVTVVPAGEYTVIITPEEIILASMDSFQFTAQTFRNGMPVPEEEYSYHWEISPASNIGSTIDMYGSYTAGLNYSANLVTETIIVSDTAHNNASATATVTVLVKYISIPYLVLPPGPLLISYRMISVGPIWPINGDALHLITGSDEYNPYLIRLFRWDGQLNEGQGDYREYPDIPELQPGIGIWAITLPGGFLQVDGNPLDASEDFNITLQTGWNQIGNPFPHAVDWNQAGNTTEVEVPWSFYGAYLPSTIMIPWNGYFVYNNSSNPVTISLPNQRNESATTKTFAPLSEKEEGFQLQIGVNNIPFFWLQDTYNFIGVSGDSFAEHDSKDLHEPPPVSPEQVSLYFPHEWEGKPERYTTDFRPLDSQKEVFEFTVNPGNGVINLMKLFWSGTEKVPEEYQTEFTDPASGITLNMREVSEYWYFSYLGIEKNFKITMTKISY